MKKNKTFTTIMAGVCAATMLVVGTLALQGADRLRNDFSGTSDGVPVIDENFDPDVGIKEVWVDNKGNAPAYVRLKLSEYQEFTKAAALSQSPSGAYDWILHLPTGTDGVDLLDCDHSQHGADFHTGFEWTFANTIPASAYNGTQTNVWIYDIDGWAYWSEPLPAQGKTAFFLTNVDTTYTDTDYYYAIDVGLEYVDVADLGYWTGDTPWTAGNQAPIVDDDIRDLFKALLAAAQTADNFYEYQITGLKSTYADGETVGIPTVKYREKGSSDAWVEATGVTVNPTTVTPTTTKIVASFTTAKGTGTAAQNITVTTPTAPINPNNPLYDYQVVNTKTDYEVGDTVALSDLKVQYKLKTGSTWADDTNASVTGISPTTALVLGANNRTVLFEISGATYNKSLTINAAPESQPAGVIGPMSNGSYYKQVAGENAHLYEVVQQNGTGTGVFIYDVNDEIPNNDDDADVATFLPVVRYTASTIVIPATETDPTLTIATTYFHKHTNSIHVPIYPGGANYMQVFHWGTDGALGGNNETGAVILSGQRKIPAPQQDNWQVR